jgi:Transposase DDE domain group 1
VSARFSERQLSTEGGALLLRETDRKIGLLSRVSQCFSDHRHPWLIEHQLGELLAQRIYGLALGYEDLNDHEELRRDPLLAVVAGKRILGKHINSNSQLHHSFSGEVVSDFKHRAEGVRIKHSVNGNSVKLYDKAYTPKGALLRAEATLHNADDFRVYRRKEGDRKGPRAWRRLRRSIADLYRRPRSPRKLQHGI